MGNLERHEYKYLLTPGDAVRLKARFDRLLLRDPHSPAEPYVVRSLYYDTPDNLDFSMKMSGAYARRKLRLRTYGRDNAVFKMEAKQKKGDLQTKLSLPVTGSAAEQLQRADFLPLLACAGADPLPLPARADADPAIRLYSMLTLGVYRPVVRIEYERTAYEAADGDVRITFDERILSSESDLDLFRNDSALLPILPEKCVLEVKFGHTLPGWISDVLAPFHLTRTAFSKYTMGRPLYYMFDG